MEGLYGFVFTCDQGHYFVTQRKMSQNLFNYNIFLELLNRRFLLSKLFLTWNLDTNDFLLAV